VTAFLAPDGTETLEIAVMGWAFMDGMNEADAYDPQAAGATVNWEADVSGTANDSSIRLRRWQIQTE
jgi:hypothetical protein